MEKFHWLDQNSELPNFVFATLRFAVPIDPVIARQALLIGLRRQPLALMKPNLVGGRWCWEPIAENQLDGDQVFSSQYVSVIDDEADQSESLKPQSKLQRDYVSCFLAVSNLSERASRGDKSLRNKVVSEINFHSHHAASDGVASIGLVNDWLTIYNNLVAGEAAENGLIELDRSSFEKRGVLGLLSWNYLKGLPQQAIALFGAAKFIFRTTKTIAAETPALKNSVVYPAIKGAWVTAETLKADRSRAAENQVGYPAWCLAKCFVAIDKWNLTRGAESDGAHSTLSENGQSASQTKSGSVWRILLPISIRTAADRAAVAANRTAIVQIDRQPPENEVDLVPFCKSIDYEINFIRRWQLEKIFLLAIRCASLSNFWLAKTANNPVSRGAAVFTHLGRPFKRAIIHLDRISKSAKNLSLARPIDFDLAGPVRSGTPINISFARFDHRLKISLHYDSLVISPDEADRLLATIVNLFSSEVA